ncbi:hypothetical protein PoB_003082200 [Plakobranchus ocellatus]|uniref:Uncharacterized protein n=1 Tax=Plakobranchus ocellatus TaxID=259542 RepID=A0AAV4ABQ9_9GAST|nr:hypothetical protein PoB_003082200 [Plakobranchus ocellatus]
MAAPFPLSNRASDVRPGCKTQRIAPTLRQVADLMCARIKEREYFKTCIVGHVNCCVQCAPTLGLQVASPPVWFFPYALLLKIIVARKCFPNIRTEEKRALKELKNNADIIIKPADKGGAVVVLNTTDYIAECTRQLSNATYYRKLYSDPTKKYNKRISDRLEIGVRSGKIDSDTAKRLIVPHPVPDRLYILPKIHKEGNPGRPILSGNGCPT